MMEMQFVSLKKLTGRDIVRVAATHNLRQLQAEIGADDHIDAARTRTNQIIFGPSTASAVSTSAASQMDDAGIGKPRKDAVRAIEIVFSLPVVSNIESTAFFTECLSWSRGFFKVPVLSAVIHLDESAPHCHVILLPLQDGRMQGSALVGYRTRLQAIQQSFFDQVGQRYGLTRPKAQRRLNAATAMKAASLAFTAIVSNDDLLLDPAVKAAILEAFGKNPAPLLAAIGLSMPMPRKAVKPFVEIMTKPCKLESKPRKPIGFAQSDAAKDGRTLSCVGFAIPSPIGFLPSPRNPAKLARLEKLGLKASAKTIVYRLHQPSGIVRYAKRKRA